MSAWTRYALTHDDTCMDVIVDVREPDSPEILALCAMINDFWSGADDRMSEAGDDVLIAVLNMLCRCALAAEMSDGFSAVHQFAVEGVEGWPLLNGSEGIKLVRVDRFTFESEVSIKAYPQSSAAEGVPA